MNSSGARSQPSGKSGRKDGAPTIIFVETKAPRQERGKGRDRLQEVSEEICEAIPDLGIVRSIRVECDFQVGASFPVSPAEAGSGSLKLNVTAG